MTSGNIGISNATFGLFLNFFNRRKRIILTVYTNPCKHGIIKEIFGICSILPNTRNLVKSFATVTDESL